MSTLSIIIPCYNKRNYIEECVCSVLQQSRVPDEIIIVDDCSNDGSQDIIARMREIDSRIKPILLTKNVGVSAARNIGFRAASSEYLTMLDADDILLGKDKIREEMNIIEKYDDEKRAVLAYSLTETIDLNGEKNTNIRYVKNRLAQGDNLYIPMLAGWFSGLRIPRDYCIRKKVMLECGAFNETMNYNEDYDLLIRLASVCTFYCTNVTGTGYRFMEQGLSQKPMSQHNDTMRRIREQYLLKLSFIDKTVYYCYRIANKLYRGKEKVYRMIKKAG